MRDENKIMATVLFMMVAIIFLTMKVCASITGTAPEVQLRAALTTSDFAGPAEIAAAHEAAISAIEQQAMLRDMMIEAVVSAADVNKPAQEPVTYEDLFRQSGNRIEGCKITHYCNELYPHICGNGDGMAATEVPVTPYWTCAVDPAVIPYGADVMVDYGNGVVEFWKAQDCGGGVDGTHIDLAVQTHAEADELGVKYATVYWRVGD